MVKTIKFNLIIDNKYIRNLEDLRDNFNIDDVLRYQRNGLLKKWLNVRGYNEVLRQFESITSQDNFETAKELVKIFEIEINTNQIEEALYSIKYHQQWQRNINSNIQKNIQQQSLINSHCRGYDALLQNMLNNKDDIRLIKIAMGQISKNYLSIFKYHLPSFFDEFVLKAPLVILVSLMNPILKQEFLSSELIERRIKRLTSEIVYGCPIDFLQKEYDDENLDISALPTLDNNYDLNTSQKWINLELADEFCIVIELADAENVKVSHSYLLESDLENKKNYFRAEQAIYKIFNGLKISSDRDANLAYSRISESAYDYIDDQEKKEIILRKLFHASGSNLKIRSKDTKEYWDVIESKGKQFMIVGMREGNFVRSAGNDEQKLSAEDVNGKFPILDGIDYMSNNPDHEIGYLEV